MSSRLVILVLAVLLASHQVLAATCSLLTSGSNATNATDYITASVAPGSNRLLLLAISNVRNAATECANANVNSISGAGLTWVLVQEQCFSDAVIPTRKQHAPCIPTMGGLAIYAGIFMSFFLFADLQNTEVIRYLLCASLLLFFTGFFDDLLDLHASRKLFIQIIAAFLVVAGGTRITELYDIFGINEFPVWAQIPLTMLFIIGITNAYNLIDGIDGLAGGLGTIGALTFGILFIENGYTDFAILSFCMAGALIGFLFYNFHPAQIFMGDTGSLLIGFILSVLAVNLLSIKEISNSAVFTISPALIGAVLFIPLYDIFRVFVIRLLNGDSPLKADRNHLHHMIIKQGFTGIREPH